MTTFRSDLLRVFHERGFVHQITDPAGLDEAAARPGLVGYIGFDCTADSLHVGSLVQIMLLRWMQKLGHRPIALMGGGTTRIGDPSGKEDMRQLLDDATIERNKAAIRADIERFVAFGAGGAVMLDNAEWLDELRYIPFLRDVGRHFSVNRMLSMDSVKLRLDREQPFSFLEFNYMLLQSYDFVELARRHGCRMQMGGSDQWGNIVMGVELGRRMADLSLFGLTTPLIATASGAKMGKTAAGAVWLNPDRLSDWDYWQYWRNVEDADVGRFLRLFTDLPLDEITRLERLGGAEINEAKKRLADEATALCRGRDAAARAAATAREVFEQGGAGGELPLLNVSRARLNLGLAVQAALAEAKLATSRGEARRLIEHGGVRVNDNQVADPRAKLHSDQLGADGSIKLSAGKKRHALLRSVPIKLQAAVDESVDSTAFIMGGYIADAERWKAFTSRWNEALQKYTHGLPFKRSEAANDWSERLQREAIGHLYDVIQEHVLFAVALAVDPRVLQRVMSDHSEPRFCDPYFFCFHRFIIEVMNRPELGDEVVEFIFDSGRETERLRSAWDAFIAAAPESLRRRIAGPAKFRSDDEWPPLQAADLKAWSARKRFKELRQGAAPEPDYRKQREDLLPIPAISPYYNESRLLELKAASQGQLFVTTDPPGFEFRTGGATARIGFEPQSDRGTKKD